MVQQHRNIIPTQWNRELCFLAINQRTTRFQTFDCIGPNYSQNGVVPSRSFGLNPLEAIDDILSA